MNAFTQKYGPVLLALIIAVELLLLCGFAGLAAWTYTQSQTQHQICQAFGFVAQATQNGIATNSALIKKDILLHTKDSLADAATRRIAVGKATTLLIHIRAIKC